jgi:hypothetical protein
VEVLIHAAKNLLSRICCDLLGRDAGLADDLGPVCHVRLDPRSGFLRGAADGLEPLLAQLRDEVGGRQSAVGFGVELLDCGLIGAGSALTLPD